MGNNTSNMGVSIYKIIEIAQNNGQEKIKKCVINSNGAVEIKKDSPITRQISESQISNSVYSQISNSSSNSSNDRKNTNVVKHNAKLSLNIESNNCDIISELSVEDKDDELDHVQLVIGHRTFDAVKDEKSHCFIIHACIPNFLLQHANPLRLDIYPSTMKDPNEIVYYYTKLTITDNIKEQCQKNRIHDKKLHITYSSGLVF